LGGAVVRELTRRGHDVVASGRDSNRGMALAQETGARFVPADLRMLREVDRVVEGASAIVHSAALSAPWGSPRDFDLANIRATEYLIDAAERARVRRFVHVSTPAVYFDFHDHLGVKEDHPLPPPVNDYVRTKLEAERLVERACRRGLRTTIIRPRGIFGPGDTSLLPRVIAALERRTFPVIGDGSNLVDLSYVDDAALAIALALESERAVGHTYHVTSGEPLSLLTLVTMLADGLGLPRPRAHISYRNALKFACMLELAHRYILRGSEPRFTRYTIGLIATSMTLDLTAVKRELAYEPRVGVREGIARFVSFRKNQGSAR
jgi:nucleoside-diphosphate-sugar epimerase